MADWKVSVCQAKSHTSGWPTWLTSCRMELLDHANVGRPLLLGGPLMATVDSAAGFAAYRLQDVYLGPEECVDTFDTQT